MYKYLLLFFAASLIAMPGVQAAVTCASIFPRLQVTTEVQEKFDKSIQGLARLRLNLDLAKTKGTTAVEYTLLNADFNAKEKELLGYLEIYRSLTREQLIEKIRIEIAKLQAKDQAESENRKKDKEQEDDKRNDQLHTLNSFSMNGSQAIFNRVEPGSFKMGEPGHQVDVTLTKAVELMATPVTQGLWQKVVELAMTSPTIPQHFASLKQVRPANPGENLPMESVSYGQIQSWIEGVNHLSKEHEPLLKVLIPDHKHGDLYRLPTEAQWEFVVRNRGANSDLYITGADFLGMSSHAWTSENALQSKTQPVALKWPLVVSGHPFYDMLGNVREFVADRYEKDLLGGENPYGPSHGDNRVVRGGGFSDPTDAMTLSARSSIDFNGRNNKTGFRLIRSYREGR